MTRGDAERVDVLHVITSSQRRGAETFAVDLADALTTRGLRSSVVALAPGASLGGTAGAPGSTPAAGGTLAVDVLGASALAPATLRALRRRAAGARLVVAHGSRTLPACAIGLALAGAPPVVYRSIGDPAAWSGQGLRRARTRVLLSRMAAVTVLWPAAGDSVRTLHGVAPERIHVIPNGVPAERCPVPTADDRRAARRTLGLPGGAVVVAAVGALSPEKRLGDAVAAVAALGEDVHLLVAGDGPERAALERGAEAEAPGRVHFAGTLPGPDLALAAADLVVLPSRTEGMPGVLIEAGLAGVAAVATDVGGVAEIVRDGETGVLVAPGDVAALTGGLRRALAERDRLGPAARRHCLAHFEIGAVAERWAALAGTLGVVPERAPDAPVPRDQARRPEEAPMTTPTNHDPAHDPAPAPAGRPAARPAVTAAADPTAPPGGAAATPTGGSAPGAAPTAAPSGGTAPDGPIRVLVLAKGLGRGGTERLIVGAARRLDRSQFSLDVAYLLPWKDAFVADVEATGTDVVCLDAPRPTSVAWLSRLRRLVRERDIDVVHTHMPLPAVAARLALPGRRPVFVHTEHNMWDRYRLPTRWANAATYRRNARVIAVSDGVAGSIRSSVPVEVVVHGTDPALALTGEAARAAARAELGLGPDTRVVGTVGNFTAKKDQATLLRAVAELPAAGLGGGGDTVLVLVGLGPLEQELRDLAGRLGIADRVLFTGSRNDVYALLPAFDTFALSSRFEGLPIALLEAMASGVAPVATRVGGIPEVITDGRDGLLVDAGDTAGLTAALARLLGDDDLRSRVGGAAHARAGDFDLVHAVRRAEEVYRQAVAHPGAHIGAGTRRL